MNRSSFRALFAVLTFIALANLIPIFLLLVGRFQTTNANAFIGLVLWSMVLGLAIKFWCRYDNLKNFKEATHKMDEKLAKLRKKIENN